MIQGKLSKKAIRAIDLLIVLGSELLLRDVFLPEHASEAYIATVVIVEWL